MTAAAPTASLFDALTAILGPAGVVRDPGGLAAYESDGFLAKARPAAVCLPKTTEHVAAVVRLAAGLGLPITPRGAGTGLSGGATPVGGGIVIGTSRMNRILSIDPENLRAVVQPGVVNLELSEATSRHGLYYAPDPSSQRVSTIGGNVAENAGGAHCLKYGVTTNHILGLEVVLPDGSVVWTGGRAGGGGGYDMTAALVGSEGMLGIVTKALVRLTPAPEAILVQLAAFPDIDSASHAVSKIIAAGIVPAALELMDNLTIQAVEPAYHAGYPMDAGAVLLIEVDGPSDDVHATGTDIEAICREAAATSIRAATSKPERDLLWKGRKMALAAMGRLAPNYYLHDTVVPRSKLPATLAHVRQVSADYRLPIANVFHAGDGNLHPLMLFDRRETGVVERVLAASHELIHHCVELGGALSGEHGIGSEKREYMSLVYSGEDLAAMAGLKNSFDPRGCFNPEKMFPTGYRCGEVRALERKLMDQRLGIYAV